MKNKKGKLGNMKRKLVDIISVLIITINLLVYGQSSTQVYALSESNSDSVDVNSIEVFDNVGNILKETSLGIGGGGMLFAPSISPFNVNNMMVTCDMGGMYVSHDAGETWTRKNLSGRVHKTYFDPNRSNVLYAGGSGLYRSTDNGKNFELVFPNKNDFIARLNSGENNSIQYLYSKSGIYPTGKMVKDILVNPNNSDNIFVLMYYGSNGEIYESKDNGESFEKIISYTKKIINNTNFVYDYNQLIYEKETDTIYYSIDEGIYKFNRDTKTAEAVYTSEKGIVGVSSVIEEGKTIFIVLENSTEVNNCDTKVFYTSDFKNITDITEKILKNLPTSFITKGIEVTYNWAFLHLDATSTKNIYLTQSSYVGDKTLYTYGISGLLHFDGDASRWIYGNNPAIDNNKRNQWILENHGWSDGNYRPYGVAVSKQLGYENAVLYTTLTGIYYTPDSDKIYQRYTKVIDENGTKKYVTNGIDEQTTYGVRINPFDENNIYLLNTDLGLIRSENNGKSWETISLGIPSSIDNTIYDMEFDPRNEGVAYSIWASRHDAPYTPRDESGTKGAFAKSTDGGKTWDTTYSTGLPSDITPVKMSVIFPEESSQDAIIYIATFNKGFFVSYDSGKTFTEINEGITPVDYDGSKSFILASEIEARDGRVFGVTARSLYQNGTQPGEVFELIDNKWQKIELPEDVTIPRDVYYHDGVLYISSTTNRKYKTINGVAFYNYGGGCYAYKNGEMKQIFDDSVSVTGIQIDSNDTIYMSDVNGNIYRKEIDGEYKKIYNKFHTTSKGIQLINDNTIYLATLGGGLLRLEGLEKLNTPKAHVHNLISVPAKEPTCTTDGNKEYYKCTECEKMFLDALGTEEITITETVIQATGHDWGDWETTLPATVDSEGVKTRICKNDDSHKETTSIDKLTPTIIDEENPTHSTNTNTITNTISTTNTITESSTPQTGDNIIIWIIIMLASLLGLICTSRFNRNWNK